MYLRYLRQILRKLAGDPFWEIDTIYVAFRSSRMFWPLET